METDPPYSFRSLSICDLIRHKSEPPYCLFRTINRSEESRQVRMLHGRTFVHGIQARRPHCSRCSMLTSRRFVPLYRASASVQDIGTQPSIRRHPPERKQVRPILLEHLGRLHLQKIRHKIAPRRRHLRRNHGDAQLQPDLRVLALSTCPNNLGSSLVVPQAARILLRRSSLW